MSVYNLQGAKCDNCGVISHQVKPSIVLGMIVCNNCYCDLMIQNMTVQQHIYHYMNSAINAAIGGEPEMAEIRFTNGDTEDWVKLELRSLSKKDFDQVLGFLKLVIPSNARNWDSKRNCWFIKTEYVNILLDSGGLKTFIEGLASSKGSIVIIDKREKLESFDEFFNVPPPNSEHKPKTKDELVKAINKLALENIDIGFILPEEPTLEQGKQYYRKLALAFHPDRNNGDGTKMSELNLIWNELKEKF